MKSNIAVDWNIRKNSKFLLLMLALCGVMPHVMLSLLQIASTSDSWSPAEIEAWSNFFVSQWVPFWLTLIAYLRLQKMDNFSLIPAICAAVVVLTFLPRFDQRSVMTIALAIPLMLVVELTVWLKNAETSANAFVKGIAADRGILRAFLFWAVVFPCVIFISCEACTWQTTVVSPFQMLPIPAVLLFDAFRHQKHQPPTVWSVMVMLAMVPLSLFLATIGPMEKFRLWHLMSLGIGYVILFLMLIVYNIDQWKSNVNNP